MAFDKREAWPWRILRSVRPPPGHAPTVILDRGDAAWGSGRAIKQGLSVHQGPQSLPCPAATATPATRRRRPATIGRAYPGGFPDLGNSHRVCPPVIRLTPPSPRTAEGTTRADPQECPQDRQRWRKLLRSSPCHLVPAQGCHAVPVSCAA